MVLSCRVVENPKPKYRLLDRVLGRDIHLGTSECGMRSCGIVRENLKSVSLLVARDVGLVLDVGNVVVDWVHVTFSLSHYFTSSIKSHLSFRTVCSSFFLVLLVLHYHALLSLRSLSKFMLTVITQ